MTQQYLQTLLDGNYLKFLVDFPAMKVDPLLELSEVEAILEFLDGKDDPFLISFWFMLDALYVKFLPRKNWEQVILADKHNPLSFAIAADAAQDIGESDYIVSVLQRYASEKDYTFVIKCIDFYSVAPGLGKEYFGNNGNHLLCVISNKNKNITTKLISQNFPSPSPLFANSFPFTSFHYLPPLTLSVFV